MSQLNPEGIIPLLKEFTQARKRSLQIILIGGLALHFYGRLDRITVDVDAEVKGDLEGLFHFLKAHHVPADLSENISGWSVIAMPSGYQERAVTVYEDSLLVIKTLAPLDFIIAKLRRFTEEDIEDALFVARKYGIHSEDLRQLTEQVIKSSIQDTALFLFRNNVQQFLDMIRETDS